MVVGTIRSTLAKLDDVPTWPIAELYPGPIPAEIDEAGSKFCAMLTIQEVGPLEEGSGGGKSKRDVIMAEGKVGLGVWDVARGKKIRRTE